MDLVRRPTIALGVGAGYVTPESAAMVAGRWRSSPAPSGQPGAEEYYRVRFGRHWERSQKAGGRSYAAGVGALVACLGLRSRGGLRAARRACVGRSPRRRFRRGGQATRRRCAAEAAADSQVREAGVPPPRNLYELLGLNPDISVSDLSAEEVKRRQRKLLRACHPDVVGPAGSSLMALLLEAATATTVRGPRSAGA
eukprot:TRINITY_DN17409_c0_g1_i1.p1 TRINITY_DN17409_c0_g1~~TRINITY_DN17409_c0_g1_i1.p1  ORF type:complete len:197 (-),score=16.04 TRINITY_DN17409_c0_g1_i1:757-1347(-)